VWCVAISIIAAVRVPALIGSAQQQTTGSWRSLGHHFNPAERGFGEVR